MSFTWTEFYAGDELRFTYNNSLYPSSDWTLTAYFIGLVTGSVVASALDSTQFQVTASSTLTSTFATGSYNVYLAVNRGTERYIVEKTTVNVLPNPATFPVFGTDIRSHTRRVYDALCAVIEGRASQTDLAISIAGRSLQRTPIKDLVSMKNLYEQMLKAEEQKDAVNKGEDAGKQVLVRFI